MYSVPWIDGNVKSGASFDAGPGVLTNGGSVGVGIASIVEVGCVNSEPAVVAVGDRSAAAAGNDSTGSEAGASDSAAPHAVVKTNNPTINKIVIVIRSLRVISKLIRAVRPNKYIAM